MNRKNMLFGLLQKCRNVEQLEEIQAQAVTNGLFHIHQPFACKLLDTYTKLGKPQEAHKVFNQIQHPDVISWTCLINLYLRADLPAKSISVFSQLIRCGLRPDSFSIVGALSACGRSKDFLCGKVVHGMVFRLKLGLEYIVGNALIDMYGRNGHIRVAHLVFEGMETKDVSSWTSLFNGFIQCNDLKSARQLFDEMPERNSISWTAMITGYVRGESAIRALELFQQMKAEGRDHPTAITIVAVLSGCADIGALDLGQSIHGYVNKCNLSMDVTVNNALMNLYSKSGSIDLAINIFNRMVKKDVFSWTTMISGHAFHGKGRRALEVFSDMSESGVNPNEVTFLSLLSACSHAGLVVEGKSLFEKMIQCHGFKPRIEHYGCMVDLLGRAGLLEEANELIELMPINPDAIIWRSFLTACLLGKNLNLAEMAGKKLIKLEPDDDGVYVLLWNIYRAANRWDEALNTRKLMRERRVKKKPGCSWVEVNGVVHEFRAEDTTYLVQAEIYILLEGITEHLKFHSDFYS